ncbi:alpha/beta hydrolase [Streptomyces sp. NBC_01717]|uniref:alpha/beta hydrolase n=1 Tax=Streptomyces sp. NBC_01717 TaxID=2975918 RepID=UPI002E3541C2|nr:alpha/beta hydrolase [Streptomyces sp. NBC_01717]
MPDYVPPQREPVLEPAARELAEATAPPPFPFDPAPVQGRTALEKAQSAAHDKPEMDDRWVALSGGPKGSVAVRILRPKGVTGTLPATLYIHGPGWAFGNADTHGRLVRELALGARTALVFPEYTPAPVAGYPFALEECYAVARWLTSQGAEHGIDPERLAVVGDSAGGNIAAALTLLAKERGDVSFIQQVLFYPITNASFDTRSHHQSVETHPLRRDAMQRFWDQYTTDETQRAEITASPLRATEEQLSGLPPALVITAEADVLRDEGEAYAAKLRAAGVSVTATRYGGTTHDFVMLNALASAHAARAATAQVIATLRQAFGTDV